MGFDNPNVYLASAAGAVTGSVSAASVASSVGMLSGMISGCCSKLLIIKGTFLPCCVKMAKGLYLHTCGLGLPPLPGCCLPARVGPRRLLFACSPQLPMDTWLLHRLQGAKVRGRTEGARQWHGTAEA